MDVAALCPFDVGVVRWRSPSPALTVIVKATWSYATGRLTPAPQEPLSADMQSPGSEGLDWASDFVPYKPRADVIVVGHARAPAPSACIAVRVGVAGLDRLVYALSAEPTVEIPLTTAYLRAGPRADARAAAVGPSPVWASRPLLGASPDAGLVGPNGVPLGPLTRAFDFGLFNVAPSEQQPHALAEDGKLVLEGLGPNGARIETALPGVRPRVFLVDGAGGETQELSVVCDTLAVDSDRLLCVLVFRGALVLDPGKAEPALVVVAAEGAGESLEWPGVLGELFSARRLRAAELRDEPELPRLHDSIVPGKWGDETTTRVREAMMSRPPRGIVDDAAASLENAEELPDAFVEDADDPTPAREDEDALPTTPAYAPPADKR